MDSKVSAERTMLPINYRKQMVMTPVRPRTAQGSVSQSSLVQAFFRMLVVLALLSFATFVWISADFCIWLLNVLPLFLQLPNSLEIRSDDLQILGFAPELWADPLGLVDEEEAMLFASFRCRGKLDATLVAAGLAAMLPACFFPEATVAMHWRLQSGLATDSCSFPSSDVGTEGPSSLQECLDLLDVPLDVFCGMFSH